MRLEASAFTVDACKIDTLGGPRITINGGGKMTREIREFGRLVRLARHESGLTLRELASQIGVSHAYVSILEIGRNPKTHRPSRPSPNIIRALARELDLDANKLLSLAGHQATEPEH